FKDIDRKMLRNTVSDVQIVSNKQTLYHISAVQISLNTISNGHLAFMKMTGDGNPPESSSYDGSGMCQRKKGEESAESGKGDQWGFGGENAMTSRNAVAPPTGMQWAGISLRFTISHATDI
ncbi:hypothetical protein DBV15_05162, partial [Temnothorax longispinosus]